MRILIPSLLVLTASPVLAQGIELQPSELSDADIAIRVVSVGAETPGSRLSVEVANRTDAAKSAQVDCSIFGSGDAPIGTETAYAERIPADGTMVRDISTKSTGITRVLCRVVDVQDAR